MRACACECVCMCVNTAVLHFGGIMYTLLSKRHKKATLRGSGSWLGVKRKKQKKKSNYLFKKHLHPAKEENKCVRNEQKKKNATN